MSYKHLQKYLRNYPQLKRCTVEEFGLFVESKICLVKFKPYLSKG